MAIIIDKEKKRRDIALSCTGLLLDKGFKNLRISEIATTAGVGKGTIYDYYNNKEEIVFEIIRNLIEEHQRDLSVRFRDKMSCKEKVFQLFDFYLCEYKEYDKHLIVYKEYMSVALSVDADEMHEFNRECSVFLRRILKDIIVEAIDKGEIIKESIDLIDGLMSAERGFMLKNWAENINCKQEFKKYINVLFQLIEIKK